MSRDFGCAVSRWLRSGRDWPEGTEAGLRVAADEIERLREALQDAQQENKRVRAALNKIWHEAGYQDEPWAYWVSGLCKGTLEGK
jgi:hypothetical protein